MRVRRNVTAWLAVMAALAALANCSGDSGDGENAAGDGGPHDRERPNKGPAVPEHPDHAGKVLRLIGDGSTAYTGPQPNRFKTETLQPGKKPPQFVVFSWDGAGQDEQKLFSHFREVGKKYGATMTYFLSGVYMLPNEKRDLYDPPRHPRGTSSIGFNDVEGIRDTVEQLRGAWLDGNEIGTHFNGHFCGPNDGVGTWTPDEWMSETRQAELFVKNWKTNTGLEGEEPLPFDYEKELVGGRAPCLEGQKNLLRAAKEMGWRYDASSVGGLQVWPRKIDGIWDFPLQQIPVPGRSFETLSMDYNFLANQSGSSTNGKKSKRAGWGRQMRDGLLAAFDRAYEGNRAPLFIGNHFESWNGGTYMRAVEEVIKEVCPREGVYCVSFKQMADWLDAQNPMVLEKLRQVNVGQRPEGGWKSYLAAEPTFPRSAAPAERERDGDHGRKGHRDREDEPRRNDRPGREDGPRREEGADRQEGSHRDDGPRRNSGGGEREDTEREHGSGREDGSERSQAPDREGPSERDEEPGAHRESDRYQESDRYEEPERNQEPDGYQESERYGDSGGADDSAGQESDRALGYDEDESARREQE
ncbi:hypothetical protein [Streptomyces cucumeris]|uniref:hypothetical protein n=1 Tax=Streptomyces cucumeris TaxID=2962890 RepID=UPI003D7578BF